MNYFIKYLAPIFFISAPYFVPLTSFGKGVAGYLPNTIQTDGNNPPVVSITSPESNTIYTAPASITITVSATDVDGSVSSVKFFNGVSLIGSDNTAPFSFTWDNVPAGNNYQISVIATDNEGASVASAPVIVTVAPGVTIEGETACDVDGETNDTLYSGFKGTGYVNTDNFEGAVARWAINSSSAQTVNLGIRYAYPNGDLRSIQLKVNGVTQIESLGFPVTSKWKILDIAITLSQGLNTLELISLDHNGNPYIDQLIFRSTTVALAECIAGPHVTFQAESVCEVDGIANDTNNLHYRGTGYVNTDNFTGAAARWYINSTSAQTVNLMVRYAHHTLEGRDMALRVNESGQTTTVSFPPTPQGTTWRTSTVPVSLSAGLNVVELSSLTALGSPYIDELTFGSADISLVDCNGGLVNIQAESACSVDGILNETVHPGYRGTGYVNSANFKGASVKWMVNSATNQTVDVRIRYSHNTATGREMMLNVNKINQIPDINFPPTSQLWKTVTVPVSLVSGNNEINLISLTDAGAPYLDQLTFTSTSISAGTCDGTIVTGIYSSVAPNPSSGTFHMIPNGSVESFSIYTLQGSEMYRGGYMEEGAKFIFGEELPGGIYILDIYYTNGVRERKKICKII